MPHKQNLKLLAYFKKKTLRKINMFKNDDEKYH